MPRKSKGLSLEIGQPTLAPEGLDIGTPTPNGGLENILRSLVKDYGYTPEAAGMVGRFVASGMDLPTAMNAVNDYMGMNRKPQSDQEKWDAYAKEHPYLANTKKLLVSAGRGAADVAKGIGSSVHPDQEKLSAAKMLKEYLAAQDVQRANEMQKNNLWFLARMPGAPLAGQPVYMGPPTEGPIAPMRTSAGSRTAATAQNNEMALQDNLAYQKKFGGGI